MKKNGFTLIELLAVIVILAIIALIATPIVINIIENSKKSATIRGAEYYLNAVELAVARNRLDSIKLEGTYNILSNGNICNQNDITNEVCNANKEITIDVSGEIPDSGTIEIENSKITNINLTYDGKVVVKENNELVFDGENTNNNNNNNNNNVPEPVSFDEDTWETIIANVKAGNLSKYNVGDTREIELDGYENGETDENGNQIKTYTVRIANKSNDDPVCTNETNDSGAINSKTACGFVIEFVDIILNSGDNAKMNSTSTNVGGWKDSAMRKFVTPLYDDNGNRIADSGIIYDSLEDVVREAIIDTTVVSGHGSTSGETNFVTEDKLYLLSTREVWGSNLSYDTANAETRQLDYYKDYENTDGTIGVTTSKYSGAIKNKDGTAKAWWLRSADSDDTSCFYYVASSGGASRYAATNPFGVAVAFRLG